MDASKSIISHQTEIYISQLRDVFSRNTTKTQSSLTHSARTPAQSSHRSHTIADLDKSTSSVQLTPDRKTKGMTTSKSMIIEQKAQNISEQRNVTSSKTIESRSSTNETTVLDQEAQSSIIQFEGLKLIDKKKLLTE
jgi:hypothetical protein